MLKLTFLLVGSPCIPGQQLECACLGGTRGVQACNESGTGFAERSAPGALSMKAGEDRSPPGCKPMRAGRIREAKTAVIQGPFSRILVEFAGPWT